MQVSSVNTIISTWNTSLKTNCSHFNRSVVRVSQALWNTQIARLFHSQPNLAYSPRDNPIVNATRLLLQAPSLHWRTVSLTIKHSSSVANQHNYRENNKFNGLQTMETLVARLSVRLTLFRAAVRMFEHLAPCFSFSLVSFPLGSFKKVKCREIWSIS